MSVDPRAGPRLQEHEVEEALHAGARLFDAEAFWEAHEAWEAGWHRAPSEERDLFQGLIHVTAACFHHVRGNPIGFRKQREKAQRRLGPYGAKRRDIAIQDLLHAIDALPAPGAPADYPKMGLAPAASGTPGPRSASDHVP